VEFAVWECHHPLFLPSLSYGYPESVKIGDGCDLHIYFYDCAFDSQVYDHTARSRQAHNDVGVQYCIWSTRASELLKESIPRHKDPSNSLLRCTNNPKTKTLGSRLHSFTNLRKPTSHEEETIASETEPADASPLSSIPETKQEKKKEIQLPAQCKSNAANGTLKNEQR
jgi:hypothetical protein